MKATWIPLGVLVRINSAKVITPISHNKQTVIIISVYINGRRGKPEKKTDLALISDWPTTSTDLSQSLVL